MITLDTLIILDAIDRKGTFAAAAADLHRVPSALTYSVQKAEEQLGVTLFQRDGRKVKMTAACEHLLSSGRELLDHAQQVTNSTKAIATGWEPKFSIAVDSILATEDLFPLLNTYQQLNPDADITLQEEVLTGTVDSLLSKRADLAVGIPDDIPLPKGIRTAPYLSVQMILVTLPDHPLTTLTRKIAKEDIAPYRIVVARDSSQQLPTNTTWWQSNQPALKVSSMTAKIAAQKAGLGIGRLPRHRIQQELASGELVELKEAQPSSKIKLLVGWREGDTSKTLAWFKQQLKK